MDAAAEVIARLEGAKGALLFASGCAAISTSLLSFAKAGDHIVSGQSLIKFAYMYMCMLVYLYTCT